MSSKLFNAITVYTISNCANCEKAKDILMRWGINFQEVCLLSHDKDAQKRIIKKTGLESFPQILLGEKVLGGVSDLEIDHCLAMDI